MGQAKSVGRSRDVAENPIYHGNPAALAAAPAPPPPANKPAWFQHSGWGAIHHAAYNGGDPEAILRRDARVARELQEGGIDVRAQHFGGAGATPLHCAVGGSAGVEVVQYLLDNGADPLKEGAWFHEDELVNAYDIALEAIEFCALFGASAYNSRPAKKLAVLLARPGAPPVPCDVYALVQGLTAIPLLLSPEMRVHKCIVGALNCAALLTDSGQVFTFGSASNGKLGHRNKVSSVGPRRVFGAIANRRIADLAVGSMHMICCDEFGSAFAWGSNRSFMLGLPMPKEGYYDVPKLIDSLSGHRVTAVAAGAMHSIFLTDKGWPFMAGSALQGRLGVFSDDAAAGNHMHPCPVKLDVLSPSRILEFADQKRIAMPPPRVRIKQISAGEAHSLLLDEDGQAWAFGIDTNGRCTGEAHAAPVIDHYSDGRQKPSRFVVACVMLPKVVERGVSVVSASKTQSLILLKDGSAWIFRDGRTKIATGMVAGSSGPTERVSLVDGDGTPYIYQANKLNPVNCPDRIMDVSEGAFGTLLLVGRNRSVLGEELHAAQKKALFTDVAFVCGSGEKVVAHRCILRARLLPESVLLQEKGPEIACGTVPATLVNLFLSWCYTDRVTPGTEAAALAALAEKWGAPSLASLCRGGLTEASLASDMRKLLLSEDGCDLELLVGPHETVLRVHRAVLVARSQFHRTLLIGGFAEAQASKLHVVLDNEFISLSSSMNQEAGESDVRCLKLLIEFLYTDKAVLEGDANLALQLMAVANQFQLQRLLFLCEQVVLESLDSDSCAYVFSLANMHNAVELKAACVVHAMRDWDAVAASDAFLAMPQEDQQLFALLARRKE